MVISKKFETCISEASDTGRQFGLSKTLIAFLLVYLIATFLTALLTTVSYVLYWLFIDVRFLTNEAENLLKSLLCAMPLFSTAGTVFTTTMYCVKIEKRSFRSMGLAKNNVCSEYLKGLGIGSVLFFIVFILLWVTDAINIESRNDINFTILVIYLIGFMVQGFSEELLLRGFCLVSLASNTSVLKAIVTNSALFSLLHIFNNGIAPLGLINIFLFGIFASLYFERAGSIWGISAIHSIWNFMQGNVFGFKVSGNTMESTVFNSEIGKNVLLNGGVFGPEGGIAVTVVLFIGIVILLIMKNKDVVPET